jgi:hypothetical protein
MWLLERGGEGATAFAQRRAPAIAIALALICALAPMLSIL